MWSGTLRARPIAAAAGVLLCLAIAGQARAASIKELFAAFTKDPKKETFLPVHKAVTSAETYEPYSRDLDQVADLLKEGKAKEAQAKLKEAELNLLLSPRAHFYASSAARKLGDAATAKLERAIGHKCIKGILSTGDATEQHPLLVTRVSDEYDVLRALGKRMASQGLIHKGEKSYDAITCADGSQLWFDITVIFRQLRSKLKPK